MDIKNIYDVSVSNIPKVTKTTNSVYGKQENYEKPVKAEKANSGHDTVNISSEATFKSNLSKEVKKYVAEENAIASSTSVKLDNLKQLYNGDNCPISSSDIASSIMKSVCGYAV
ncbi:MAG: hypothetical protein R3Y12_00890 [Clostridia bacterium]